MMTARFPTTLDDASAIARSLDDRAEPRAGATDFMERHELGLTAPMLIDLRDVEGLDQIHVDAREGARIGAKVTIARIAADPRIRTYYPALALAAGALATPEIRAVATLAGGLLQRSRCWYYRRPEHRCLKHGGSDCPARSGDHLYHVCFDLGPCIAPHPSTLGMALLGHDATLAIVGGPDRSIAELYGDGSSPLDHQLRSGELVAEVRLPAPIAGERGGYRRAIARARAEWPLIEVSTRLVIHDGRVTLARVTLGGVAPIPLRLPDVEAALLGGPIDDDSLERAAARSTERCNPLPMTRYKVEMLPAAVFDALVNARGNS